MTQICEVAFGVMNFQKWELFSGSPGINGEGVYDWRMNGVLPPSYPEQPCSNYQKLPSNPLLWLTKVENDPFLTNFCQLLPNPPMFKENLPKKGPLFREIWSPKNPSIWTAYTCTVNMLCMPLEGSIYKDSGFIYL